MKKVVFFALAFCLFSGITWAQDVFGKWYSIDPDTGENESIIRVYEKDQKVFAQIETILKFGYPGQTTSQKMEYNSFELIDSPTPGRESNEIFPKILAEAYQVYECTLDVKRIEENPILRDSTSTHLLLNIDNILLKEKWLGHVDGTKDTMPDIALTYGFRGGATFWFGEAQPAYKLPIPDMGPNYEIIHYEANRIDDDVKFTWGASKQLTGIPNAFLQNVLGGIVKQAKARGITEVDEDFVLLLNKEREQ